MAIVDTALLLLLLLRGLHATVLLRLLRLLLLSPLAGGVSPVNVCVSCASCACASRDACCGRYGASSLLRACELKNVLDRWIWTDVLRNWFYLIGRLYGSGCTGRNARADPGGDLSASMDEAELL